MEKRYRRRDHTRGWVRLAVSVLPGPTGRPKPFHSPSGHIRSPQRRQGPPADNEQLFIALRLLEREVEYVLYPESDHSMSSSARPDRRVDRMERIVGGFTKRM